MIGTRLANRYEVTGELGRGGMGVVYRAMDPLLRREVAIKLIPPSLLSDQAEERFQREAQVVAQMDHPAIVPIYDIGRHEGSLFFLMPVVRGASLRAALRETTRSLGDVIDIAIQTAEALDYSHARGIVHRDIKPENIMVADEEGGLRVRVMDFGLAKASSESRLTKTGTLVGTMAYFSPEQVMGGTIDSRSDIYSLGVVIYESLAGEPPFTGEAQSVLYRIVHEQARAPRSSGLDLSEELDGIVMRCLAKDPARRFQKASELAEALRRYQSHLHESDRRKSIVLSSTMTAQFQRPLMPFVGREKEVAELQHRLNLAIDGECQFVAIAGEPGIGKSRLIEEIENLARVRKVRILHGRFVEQDRAFAYQGFVEMIQEYFRGSDASPVSGEGAPDFSDLAHDLVTHFPVLGEVAGLRSASGPHAQAVESRKADDRMYVYELLARTLTRIAAGRPLLLVFENLHGAEMSLDAIGYVVRRLGPTPTLIVGTYRQTEIDKRHPLVRLLDGFNDDPRFASIYLGPFSRSEHRRFVESVVGSSQLASGLPETLFDATEANPFFTKELLRSLIDSGGIARADTGEWSLSGEMAISSGSLPATIQQAVEKRIERLPEEVLDILSMASVIGKSFDARDIETLADGRRDVEDVIEKLISEGILEEERESRGDRLTFASGIVRDVLYGALSRRKRKSIHRRYAEHLERRYAGRLERIAPQLLHHFSEGDVPEKSVQYGMDLARRSVEAFSPEEAVRVLKLVLEFLDDDEFEGDRSATAEARLLLATANRMLGNVDAALREAEAAARAFEKAGDRARAAEALLLAAETAWQGRRVEETRRWLEQGLEAARASKARALAPILSLAATVANLRGEYARAKELLDECESMSASTHERAADAGTRAGGALVVALANPPAATEPAEINIVEEGEALALVFENLVSSDDQGHVVPHLAEKWEVLGDGTSLLFTLRDGVRFRDGSLLSPQIVKSSFERVIRHRSRSMPGAFSVIRGARALADGEASEASGIVVRGPREIELQILEPLPIYPSLLNDPTTAIGHVSETGTVGTGAYRIVSQDRALLRMERNPDYWKGTGGLLDSIEFRLLPNASAIADGLRSGTIDLARDLLPEDLDEILRDARFRDRFVEAPKKTTYFALFRAGSETAANESLRRVMFGGVRVHDLVWRSLGRLAQPAVCLIPPSILGHDAGRKRIAIGREQALELLRTSGITTPLRLKASVHPLLLDRFRSLTEALFEAWREVGIEIDVTTPTMNSYLASFRETAGIDLIIGRWNADYDDPDNFTNGLFRSETGIFSSYFSSPETDALFDDARTETRPAAREGLYRKFENQVIDAGMLLPLFHEIDYRVANASVRGLQLRSTRPYVNYLEIGKVEQAREEAPAVRVASGTIFVPVAQPVHSLDPMLARTAEDFNVVSTIYETLTRCGEGARIVPWLVSEFHAEAGGSRYRFRLRDDVRFHDGRRLTSRDVRYSWERGLLTDDSSLKGSLSPIRGAQKLIAGESHDLEGFRILSAREFVVELEKPLAFFPALISNATTAIVPEGTERVSGNWRGGCVGTGPFRVVRFEPGVRLELERHPRYWREGYPRSEALVFRLAMSAEEVRDEFRAGRLSLAAELLPADVAAFRHDPDFASGFREVPRLSTYYAVFNARRGPLADLELRRSILEGVDIAAVVQRTIGRLAIPAHGIIPPGLVGYAPATPRPPAPARKPREGPAIELTAAVHPVMLGQYAALSRELTNIFAERGVTLRVVSTSLADFLSRQVHADADVAVGRWIGDYPDADTFVRGMLHAQEGAIGRYLMNAEIDRLSDAARAEIDPAARHAIYRRVEEIVARDALLLPLFHEQVYRFARPEVEGLRLNVSIPEVAFEELSVRSSG